MSKPVNVPRKPGGATPTMVNGLPLIFAVRPTTLRSPSKRLRHTRCERTATALAAVTLSSLGRNPLPSIGRTPSSAK